jgi:hypothetical protein
MENAAGWEAWWLVSFPFAISETVAVAMKTLLLKSGRETAALILAAGGKILTTF